MKKKQKRIRRSINREAILRYIEQVGLITAEKLINILLSVGAIGGAMMTTSKRDAIHNLKNLGTTFEGVDFTSPDSVCALMAKLDKEGLIHNENGTIKIVQKGIRYLAQQLRIPYRIPCWDKKYKLGRKNAKTIHLIIFDIPEKERRRRNWLRQKLKEMDYGMMQRSVWWGRRAVPFEFISDLKKYRMLDHVHIMKVYKQGSISRFLERTGANRRTNA